ncbi:glycosyltransferase [Ferruginibacter paludis]|uniref:glycosyltransferase n=1 Tax=Ferruginibacter paludis TaxID=1310417 RepID=UPI0025B58003|nr:glycosyltransferase [Ferruginibacter paludis]MDN3658885.1 glycosyltransferase [Ferruginibacter paludis]
MTVLQINTIVNSGSTGRIAESIGILLRSRGEESVIAFGRGNQQSASKTIRVGTKLDAQLHGLKTRLLDKHGFGSTSATKKLVNEIKKIQPDIVHLHNIHGYYINIKVLFNFLKEINIPVVWTLHDCWPFTGHCSYFTTVSCEKWKSQCHHCPLFNRYPESFFVDNSYNNYLKKKELFTGLQNMVLVTPSNWLKDLVKESFLKSYPVQVIHNGVDIEQFIPGTNGVEQYREKLGIGNKKVVLGVASIWDRRKGLADFKLLAALLSPEVIIILVGLTQDLIKELPANIIGIQRTENLNELVVLYNMASVFINPTWVDNFPTTNVEALACGTPVITYDTGGSPEAIDERSGIVIEKGNIQLVNEKLQQILENGEGFYSAACRNRAVNFFNKEERYSDYVGLYKMLIKQEKVESTPFAVN